jgi:hypothetical protein
MEPFPPVPSLEEASGILEAGHLWIVEEVDGGPLRFRLRADGRMEFGDDGGVFGTDPDAVPPEYRESVRSVREGFDREALRAAVDDPAAVTFFGVATYRRRIDYDFDRLPAFVGTEVHDGEGYLPPDRAAGAFERLGLTPVPAVEKELRAVDFDPGSYDLPRSAYADAPALGVVLRSKTGDRAAIRGAAAGREFADPIRDDPEAVAETLVTDARVAAVARDLESAGHAPGFDAVFERVVDRVYRAHAHRLAVHGADVDRRAFRSAAAPLVRERLSQ